MKTLKYINVLFIFGFTLILHSQCFDTYFQMSVFNLQCLNNTIPNICTDGKEIIFSLNYGNNLEIGKITRLVKTDQQALIKQFNKIFDVYDMTTIELTSHIEEEIVVVNAEESTAPSTTTPSTTSTSTPSTTLSSATSSEVQGDIAASSSEIFTSSEPTTEPTTTSTTTSTLPPPKISKLLTLKVNSKNPFSARFTVEDPLHNLKYIINIRLFKFEEFKKIPMQIIYDLSGVSSDQTGKINYLGSNHQYDFQVVYKKEDFEETIVSQQIILTCISTSEKCMNLFVKHHDLDDKGRKLTYADKYFDKYYLMSKVHENGYTLNAFISHQNYDIEEIILPTDSIPADDTKCENVCKNEGVCSSNGESGKDKISCACKGNYFGFDCSFYTPCQNCLTGKCQLLGVCDKCLPGFIDPFCDKKVCKNLPICHNEGICAEEKNQRECKCSPDYHGKYCEHKEELVTSEFNMTVKVGSIAIFIFAVVILLMAFDFGPILRLFKN